MLPLHVEQHPARARQHPVGHRLRVVGDADVQAPRPVLVPGFGLHDRRRGAHRLRLVGHFCTREPGRLRRQQGLQGRPGHHGRARRVCGRRRLAGRRRVLLLRTVVLLVHARHPLPRSVLDPHPGVLQRLQGRQVQPIYGRHEGLHRHVPALHLDLEPPGDQKRQCAGRPALIVGLERLPPVVPPNGRRPVVSARALRLRLSPGIQPILDGAEATHRTQIRDGHRDPL